MSGDIRPIKERKLQLQGKVAVITGGGSGIGRATAIEMVNRGAQVVVCDINDEGGEDTVREIESRNGTAQYIYADVTSLDQIETLMQRAVDDFGRLDILHNNAGVHDTDFTQETAVDTLPEEIWDRVFDVNLKGAWRAARAAARHMRISGGGVIVNAGSTASFVGFPRSSAYTSTKTAMLGLTRCMALDFAKDGIRVNCYCPASIETPMVSKYWQGAEDPDAIKSESANTHLIRRLGQPEEVANLVCFLASDEASFITGAAYVIDGGSLAWRGVGVNQS